MQSSENRELQLDVDSRSAHPDPAERAPESAWYAVYTSHQHEKAASSLLAQKGFEVFLPLYRAVHSWKDRVKQVSLPLFPGYFFLHGGLERRLAVLTTPGIHNLVSFGAQPAPIPPSQIEAIQRMVAGGTACEPHPFLKCGDRVRVKSGPLVDLEGILVRKKNLFRLVLSLELLQQSVAVEVDAGLVERVSRPPVHRAPGWAPERAPALA